MGNRRSEDNAAAIPTGVLSSLRHGWGYSFGEICRLLFFNHTLLQLGHASANPAAGHLLALVFSLLCSCLLVAAWRRVTHGYRVPNAVALLAAASYSLAFVFLLGPSWSLFGVSSEMAGHALGGAAMVALGCSWESQLASRGVRDACASRLAGTLLGVSLFIVVAYLPAGIQSMVAVVSPLLSAMAFIQGKRAAEADEETAGASSDGPARSLEAFRKLVPTFLVLFLSQLAFGIIRRLITPDGADHFMTNPMLLALLTAAAAACAAIPFLMIKNLAVSKIAQIAIPLISIATVLPAVGPLPLGTVSYLLVYIGCEMVYLFSWIPLVCTCAEHNTGLPLGFASLIGFRWTGSLVGVLLVQLTRDYTAAALVVLLCIILCMFVIMRQDAVTIDLNDAKAFDGVNVVQLKCERVGKTSGLSKRELEVCYLWVTGHTASYIENNLFISKSTVKTHLAHIYTKTGTRTKEQLIQLIESYE